MKVLRLRRETTTLIPFFRDEVRLCPMCRRVQADLPSVATPFRATILATTPLTDGSWEPVSDDVAFSVISYARCVVERLQRMASQREGYK